MTTVNEESNRPMDCPMDCTDIKSLLSALLDDHLDAPTLHRAERHLSACLSCRNFVGDAERNDRLIA